MDVKTSPAVRRRVHDNGQRFDAELDTALARGLTRLFLTEIDRM
jgi:hypothetical protein